MAVQSHYSRKHGISALSSKVAGSLILPTNSSLPGKGMTLELDSNRRSLNHLFNSYILHSRAGIPVTDFDFYCQKFGCLGLTRSGVLIPAFGSKSK